MRQTASRLFSLVTISIGLSQQTQVFNMLCQLSGGGLDNFCFPTRPNTIKLIAKLDYSNLFIGHSNRHIECILYSGFREIIRLQRNNVLLVKGKTHPLPAFNGI